MWLRRAVFFVLSLVCFLTHFNTSVFAQVQDDWQVLRIFVPEEDVGTLVPNDYNPVEIEDLTEALAREATRRTQLQSNPHIAEALYVVRCSQESLVSDQSRWAIKSPFNSATLKLDDISVALRNSGTTPADDKPLIPNLRYSADGNASLAKVFGDTNYWFGMSSVPTISNGNQSIYDVQLPAATMARMLISAPESIQIASPDVIVTQIANPREFLPDNWPSLTSAEGQRWFVVHLSGKSKFRLITELTERKDALEFQHFVRRSSLVYSASEKGFTVSADFEVERLSGTSSLKILLAKSLRVRAVTVNGNATNYRSIQNSEDLSAFEIQLSDLSSGNARLRIEALSDTVFPFDDLLPTIAIARAFSWEGRTSLLAEDDLVVDQLVLSSRRESSRPKLETTTIGKRWVVDWIGVPPLLSTSVGHVAPSCKAENLTRLTIQEGWISATTNLRITCSSLESNELRLQVGRGWFVDDLTIEKSDSPITSHLPDGEDSEIALTWERLVGEMSINLQIVAHLPKDTNAEQFRLEAPRIASVIGGLQKDHYALEQNGRFRIEANPFLQRLELSEAELSPWQTQFLSRVGVTQLFRGIGANIPPIVMNRNIGTYTAKIITTGRQVSGHLQANYSIEVQPVAGAIDSASCILTLPQGVEIPSWRVTHELNGEQVPVLKAVVHATREGSDTKSLSPIRFDLQLPDATSGKFVLQSEVLIPNEGSGSLSLPLVTMPVATETWMILPRNLELFSSSVGIISLPVSVCCDSSEFDKMVEQDSGSMVGYRYDPSLVSSVDLLPVALKPEQSGWLWSNTTKHRLYNDGNVSHQTDLQIFAPDDMTLVVNLPSRWVLNRVLLDGAASPAGHQLDSERLLIQIPRGKQVRLTLQASSQRAPLGWFTRAQFPKPTFSLASLDSSESLWLQPGRISINEIFRDEPLSVAERLSPSSWWTWLSPSLGEAAWGDAEAEGWRKLSLRTHGSETRSAQTTRPERSSGITLLEESVSEHRTEATLTEVLLFDRSSLCTVCIAILLTGAGLTFWLLGDRIAGWWFCITLSLAVVLLVPAVFIGGAQLTLLCVIGGALARLIRVVSGTRDQSSALRRGSTIVRAGSNAALLLLVLCNAATCEAQELFNGKKTEKYPSTYGVLIPLNEDGELSAKHVYAPRKLMKLLNNSDTRDSEEPLPQILGAKYMLKISGGTSLTASYVQEFTAEFDLLFNSTNYPLRLPFKSSQLQLLRGSVSGQGVFIGPRLQQTSDAITYRPPETGRVRLRLQLIPTTNGNVDRTGIEVEIPRIASSILDVVADDSLDLNIKSIGSVRRLTTTSWSAELGPTDELRVEWPSRSQRNPVPNLVVPQADTWLHVSEGQVVADCQLRINGARSLPKQLHVTLDAGWEPVGTEWNDFKLISNELSANGNRRIYLVNRESLNDRAIIRVSAVPRNGDTVSTLAVPFLALTESPLSGRTLAFSVSGKPRWKVVGSEFWNRLNLATSDLEWDPGKPPLTDLWKVPTVAISGSLQRVSSDPAAVDEVCELQLLSTKTSLDYRATWSQPTDAQILKLEIPSDAEPQSVRVNRLETEYQLSKRAERKFLLVNMARFSTEIRILEIQMQLSRDSTEATRLPRILLKDAIVSKSTYQVNCGAELVCTFTDVNDIVPDKDNSEKSEQASRLEISKPVVEPNAMLSNLTTPVGVIELTNGSRESTKLPMSYQVHKRLPIEVVANVMSLTRIDQGWRASVEVLMSAEKSTEFVFFDIPTTIGESIESSGSTHRVTPSANASRSTLCLIPQVMKDGLSRAQFEFRMPALGSSQNLPIPDILFLGKEVSRPALALPKRIDDQPVSWLKAGRKLPDGWLAKVGLTSTSEDYVYFELSDSQQQATWRLSEAEKTPAKVLFAWAVLDEDSEGNTIGAVNYWINPNNHLDIALDVPKSAQLIGIQASTNGAVWHAVKPDQVRILMQPNYLPVQLRVFLRWPDRTHITTSAGLYSVQLPIIEAEGVEQVPIAILSGARLESAATNHEQAVASLLNLREPVAATQIDALLAERWRSLLMKSLPVVSDLRADEFVGWMRNWSPEVVGLEGDQSFTAMSNLNESSRDTVGSFWAWYLERTTLSNAELRKSELLESPSADNLALQSDPSSVLFAIDSSRPVASTMLGLSRPKANWYLVDLPNQGENVNLTLKLVPVRWQPSVVPFAIASIVLLMTSGLLYLLFQRLRNRTNEVLAVHAWLYWAFLAVLAWLLLPVAWPSLVIAMSSMSMLAGQLLSSRRRQLALRR